MPKVLVGRDVTVFTITPAGVDQALEGLNYGAAIGFLSLWKEIRVRISADWVDVTPSSGNWKEKRRTTLDWSATIRGIVRTNGSAALTIGLNYDYLYIQFQEVQSGGTVSLIGGVADTDYERDRDEAKQSIELTGTYIAAGGDVVYA